MHYGPADPPPVPEWLNRITKLSAVQIISRRRITRRLSLRVVTKKIIEITFFRFFIRLPNSRFSNFRANKKSKSASRCNPSKAASKCLHFGYVNVK